MIYLNGKFVSHQEAALAYNDRGFLLSDGIFETMRAYDGEISCLSDHYQRLKTSAEFLGIPFSMTLDEMRDVTYKLLERCELQGKNASLRLTLTRGTGPRGLLPPEKVTPTIMISAFSFVSSILKPLKVVISKIKRNESSPLSNIKSLCYLDNILARQDAGRKGADECVMLNTHGYVACASVANIFIVTSKGVITPCIADGVLPGVTRKTIISICEANNIPIYEEKITEIDLIKAKEIFFTNRLIEIQPVSQVNDILINKGEIGEVTSMLQKLYKNYITMNFCRNTKQDQKKENEETLRCRL